MSLHREAISKQVKIIIEPEIEHIVIEIVSNTYQLTHPNSQFNKNSKRNN